MQGMDGFEACRRGQADDKSQCVPVIFITAASDWKSECPGWLPARLTTSASRFSEKN